MMIINMYELDYRLTNGNEKDKPEFLKTATAAAYRALNDYPRNNGMPVILGIPGTDGSFSLGTAGDPRDVYKTLIYCLCAMANLCGPEICPEECGPEAAALRIYTGTILCFMEAKRRCKPERGVETPPVRFTLNNDPSEDSDADPVKEALRFSKAQKAAEQFVDRLFNDGPLTLSVEEAFEKEEDIE